MTTDIPYRHPTPTTAQHQRAHDSACLSPRGRFEATIVGLCHALSDYARGHHERYESLIGDDYVLGEHWKQIANGLLGLLNGEAGRLDCGSVDSYVRQLAQENHVDLDE